MKTKKLSFLILAVLLVVMVGLVAVACNKNTTPSYTVTLDARNGEATQTLSVDEGGTVSLPTLTREGFNFLGWYTEEDGKGERWFDSKTITSNLTLYANWQQLFSVLLNSQNDDPAITVSIGDNDKITLPTPKKDGFTLSGWYTGKNGEGELWTDDLAVTKELALYAAWAVKITFNANGLTIKQNKKDVVSYDELSIVGKGITLPTPSNDVYTFDGWYTEPIDGTKVTSTENFEEDTILYAHWTIKSGHELTFDSTVEPTCTKIGYDVFNCTCGETHNANYVGALGHDFDYEDVDFYTIVECKHDGCTVVGRKDRPSTFDDAFEFTYSSIKQKEIDDNYKALIDAIASADKYDETAHAWEKPSDLYDENKAFEHNYYDIFYDGLEYITEQYQICYVNYCVYDKAAEWQARYDAIQKARTDAIANYYSLFRKIYETKYRNFFFSEEDGWSEEDIEKALVLSDTYGGGEYSELKTRIDEIEVEFRDLKDDVVKDQKGDNKLVVPELYAEYVSLNNKLAQLSGYKNYVEYAYKNVYDRDYSPEDVAHLRAFAKQYMAPIYSSVLTHYTTTRQYTYSKTSEQGKYKKALLDDSIFSNKLTSDLVGAYLKEMNIKDKDGNIIQSYYDNVNELFEIGNYYNGKYKGAFNYWIEAQQKSVLYFGPGSYSGAFTFIHEFGHYNNSYYNHGISMSYDLDETHSQGNEMMFLAYLKYALPDDFGKVYNQIKDDQLFNMLAITMLAMAVDEFEQAVYTNTYTGYEDGIAPSQYDKLFEKIMHEYGIDQSLNSAYWRFVVIESACYYISYSTSAMASLQLYAMAMQDLEENGNLDATREKYYKLITFTDDEENAHTDFVGDRVVDIGFGDTLKYAGLYSPFDEDFYIYLKDFFESHQ